MYTEDKLLLLWYDFILEGRNETIAAAVGITVGVEDARVTIDDVIIGTESAMAYCKPVAEYNNAAL
jgi:hypothetical protein